jgi:hypothetical protein
VAPGPGYRPPFPQARVFTPAPRPPFLQPSLQAPDWYNVMSESIYANRKVDINCVVSIMRGDNQLRHLMQGEIFHSGLQIPILIPFELVNPCENCILITMKRLFLKYLHLFHFSDFFFIRITIT